MFSPSMGELVLYPFKFVFSVVFLFFVVLRLDFPPMFCVTAVFPCEFNVIVQQLSVVVLKRGKRAEFMMNMCM